MLAYAAADFLSLMLSPLLLPRRATPRKMRASAVFVAAAAFRLMPSAAQKRCRCATRHIISLTFRLFAAADDYADAAV